MSCSCSSNAPELKSSQATVRQTRLVLCGPPNVGKSMIYNALTGRYTVVSNFPGTTVEISSGTSVLLPGHEVLDTPGAYSLLPISDEERVTRDILLELTPEDSVILHIVDAKNLRRMLPMTLELLELGMRVVLVLNMMDEAHRYGVRIDRARLSALLGVAIVETTATKGTGIDELCRVVKDGVSLSTVPLHLEYGEEVQQLLGEVASTQSLEAWPQSPSRLVAGGLRPDVDPARLGEFELAVRLARQSCADRILGQCASFPGAAHSGLGAWLNRLTMNLWTAIPIALAILYLGVYKFVGEFGAGTLVDFLEDGVYDRFVTPWVTGFIEHVLPWRVAQDLFVHDYGILTLGLRYAFALILPIVGTFFIMFSILEDSGYLPRLALLLDNVFKRIGLNGRAVIPIILGFGCGTMATMVTRILETKRERIIATMLLGVAIPCSAQLGVIMAMMATHPQAFLAWMTIIGAIFLTLGMLAAHQLPGEIPAFYLELPPLRRPRLSNVLTKTYSRMHWYFMEILPLFIAVSVVIWLGNVTGLFESVIGLIEPVVAAMGLPKGAASSLLFGFFRRDYGAAGLYDLHRQGLLDTRQMFVSVLVITLFLPCIAQFFVMKKERGWTFALSTAAAILVFTTLLGILTNAILVTTGWM